MKSKNEIRQLIKNKREALDPAEKEKLDKDIILKINENSDFKAANTILVYMSHKNEVDIIDFTNNKNLVLPRVNNENLDLYLIESLDDLEEGAYGIMEPKTTCKKVLPDDIDLALIPGVAFDKKGHRIGFGKGYYDRLETKLTCKKIGIAYDFQIVDEIPFESHDLPVDLLITN
jgi:5-formyltetrahydrofolate cyclo-ligase